MLWVYQHTQLRCFLEGWEIELEKKHYVYFSPISTFQENMWDVWSEHNSGTLGSLGSESRAVQNNLFFILFAELPGSLCPLSRVPTFRVMESITSSVWDWPQCELEIKWPNSTAASPDPPTSLCNYLCADYDVIIMLMATSGMGNYWKTFSVFALSWMSDGSQGRTNVLSAPVQYCKQKFQLLGFKQRF